MSLCEKLYPWQKKLVDKFSYKSAFGLFLDMGLGKTVVSLAMAEKNKCTKTLVVSINAKVLETVDEKGSWFWWAQQSDMNYKLNPKNTTEFSQLNNDLFIINYESLFMRGKNKKERVTLRPAIENFIASCKGHNVAIIIDESHKTKDLQSQQTQAITKIKQQLLRTATKTYTYLLTGTPFTAGYIDLYSQLKLLGADVTKTSFIDTYCERGHLPGLLGWQQPIVGYKNIDALFHYLHQYAITIDSSDVEDLPDKVFVYHTTSTSKDFEAFTNETMKNSDIIDTFKRHNLSIPSNYLNNTDKKINNPFYRNIDYPSLDYLAETSGTFWLRARELSIGFQGNAETNIWYDKRRLEQLKHFLEVNEDNYVLFYNYTPELLELYDICDKLGYNVDVYCGEAKSLTFYNKYCKLSESEKLVTKKNIIIANFASGATGMNWQEYNKCIIFSCPLYKDYAQGIKRIHRLGQKHTTFYHVFYQQNWLDGGMNKALQDKIDYNTNMYESDLARVQYMTKGGQNE